MRRASVEFSHLARLHDEVVLAQPQPQGNLANLQAQVITAAAAGAAINYDLILEETRQAAEKRHANAGEPDRHATAGHVA